MARVINSNPVFAVQFRQCIENLPHGWVGTCEEVRLQYYTGVKPSSNNACSAVWGKAKKDGIIVELPHQVHMTTSKSHGRKTHLYRRV